MEIPSAIEPYASSSLAVALSALSTLKTAPTSDLFGYRGFLSLVAALDVRVLDFNDLGPLTSPIGGGSYTKVYKTHLLSDPTVSVCVKAPSAILALGKPGAEESAVQLVLTAVIQELRISAHHVLKHHPNIPKVIGVAFREEDFQTVRPLVVVELACGTLTSQTPHLKWEERFRMCRDVADGLVALHSHGVVHGDIKGDNVLVFERLGGLEATISDMGGSGPEGTAADFPIPGTREFYAPECFRDSDFHSEYVNRRPRDVYSFGLLLCEVVLGEPVFGGIDPGDQFDIQNCEGGRAYIVAKLAGTFHEPDMAFSDIVSACLARNPQDRITMGEVSRRLSALLGDERCVILTSEA
jgi:serine/threonine protein kinase